jgi:hypothetical protein
LSSCIQDLPRKEEEQIASTAKKWETIESGVIAHPFLIIWMAGQAKMGAFG